MLWYLSLVVIVVAGVGLTVYSRNEKFAAASIGPSATDNWQVAYAVDLCGTIQPNLPANSNLSSVGIRTFGNGLINVDPSAVTTGASSYEHGNATLGKFATSYPEFSLTNTTISLPPKAKATSTTSTSTTSTTTTLAKGATTTSGAKAATTTSTSSTTTTTTLPPVVYSNGEACTKKVGPLHGDGTLVAEVFASPTATGQLVTSDITGIHLSNGEMITIAFVPSGSKIPAPPSRTALVAALGSSSSSSSSSSSTKKS